MSSTKPSYYQSNGADVIEMLSKTLEPSEFRGFMKGNIIKYATRYDKKNGLEDLDKAQEYKFRLSIWEIMDHKTTVPQAPMEEPAVKCPGPTDKRGGI